MRRTLIKFGAAAMFAGCLAACGGAHDGSANLEPDPQAAPVRAAPAPNQAARATPGPQPGSGEAARRGATRKPVRRLAANAGMIVIT